MFLSIAHVILSEINNILEQKKKKKNRLYKFKSIEIISSIFSDHNGLKLEINHGGKKGERQRKKQLHGD